MITPNHSPAEIQAVLDRGGHIVFAPGVYENAHYRLTKPVHLSGEGAVLVGGSRIQWQTGENGLLWCNAPTDRLLRALVVNGQLRTRCRLPETGYNQHNTVFNVRWLSTTQGGWARKTTEEEHTVMEVPDGVLDGLTLDSAEVTVKHNWSDSIVPVRSVDGNRITLAYRTDYPVGGFGVQDYILWNVPEALTVDGTFCHDRKAGKLYYRPLPGEDVTTEAYLPQYDSVFYSDDTLRDTIIEGFTVTASGAPVRACGCNAVYIPGALEFPTADHCTFRNLHIYAVGGAGLRIFGVATYISITRCHLHDIGACGLLVGRNAQSMENANGCNYHSDRITCEVSDCLVHHTGRYFPSAIGIVATDFNVRHNEVYESTYIGIRFNGSDIVVEKNIVHHVMTVLNDDAAFYSGFLPRGIIRNNLVYGVHPIKGHRLRIAYYLDECASNWLVENNVAIDCSFPNHNHMNRGNVYRGNLFVHREGNLFLQMLNVRPESEFVYENNVFAAGGTITFRMPEDAFASFRGNRFHSSTGGIIQSLLDHHYTMLGDRPMVFDDSNTTLPLPEFTADTRLFELPGLRIDLRDAGPRY